LATRGVYYMIAGDGGLSLFQMPQLKSIRYVFVPLALLALVLVTATLGGVLHHHQNSTSENTCQICHLNHQPIERPLASDRGPVMAPVGAQPEPEDYEFSPGLVVRRLPARAPPTA
jgi:hypothetical protein